MASSSSVWHRQVHLISLSATAMELQLTNSRGLPGAVRGVRRAIYLVLALLFLGLGLAGAVLPVLPTTPFLLLMSYFLVRSSPKLHARVMRLPVVGRFLRDWEEKRGVRTRVKIIAVVTVLSLVGASLLVSTLPLLAKLVIIALAAVGLTVVWRLPTIAD